MVLGDNVARIGACGGVLRISIMRGIFFKGWLTVYVV